MNQGNKQSGLGIIALIAITAILGIGGYAIYSSNTQDSKINISDSEIQEQQREDVKIASEIQADAHITLQNVRENLALNTQAGVDAALEALDNLQSEIANASINVSLEAQAELQALNNEVAQLQTSISASDIDKSTPILYSIDTTIDDLQDSFVDFSAKLEAMDDWHDTNNMVHDETMTDTDDSMMQNDAMIEEDGTMMNTEIDSEVNIMKKDWVDNETSTYTNIIVD